MQMRWSDMVPDHEDKRASLAARKQAHLATIHLPRMDDASLPKHVSCEQSYFPAYDN